MDVVIWMKWSERSSLFSLPSTEYQAVLREVGESRILSVTPAGTTIGRKDSEWGQIGVIIIAGMLYQV